MIESVLFGLGVTVGIFALGWLMIRLVLDAPTRTGVVRLALATFIAFSALHYLREHCHTNDGCADEEKTP